MATANPSLVFLCDPTLAACLRTVSRVEGLPLSELIRGAAISTLENGRPPQGLDPQKGRRSERVRIHIKATLKSILQARADADGMSLGSWVAASLADAVTTWIKTNREELGLEAQAAA